MHRLALLLVAIVALAGCDVGGLDDDVPQGRAHRIQFGFSDTGPFLGRIDPVQDAELASRAGATIARVSMGWRAVEPLRDQYAFAPYDAFYRALRSRGIRVLWSVSLAPRWAWPRSVRCVGDCHIVPARSEEDEWEEVLQLVARRYPDAVGIELWNEPNYAGFFGPRVDAKRYTRLLKRGYRAIKRIRPRLPVVHGGLANFFDADAEREPLEDFLEAIYDHGGGDYTDAIAVHPYPGRPGESRLLPSIAAAMRVRDAHGDSEKPIWVTELGVTTTGTDPGLRWTPPGQARELVGAYRRLARTPGVELVAIHTLVEPLADPANSEAGYGLVRGDLSPKPAYCALAREVTGGRGSTRGLC